MGAGKRKMENTDFDIIVVGSGCAGAVAATIAARAGKSVLVVERGNFAGSKNMTGGRLYAHSLREVFPDFEKQAPLERKIIHERISLLDTEANLTIDFMSNNFAESGKDSFSVLRGPFDQWLAEQAEEAGAEYIYGIAVEDLLKDESGAIVGIVAGGDEVTAKVTIVADGVNSLLSGKATGAPLPAPNEMAIGIKEVFELSTEEIDARLLCNEGEGAAWLFVGDCTHGHIGGGFMYTNKDSISLGLVATLSDLATAAVPIYQMMDDFKHHPAIAPLIKGARLVEHSGHLVPEGGYNMIPSYVGNGCLLAGDAAMLCMNLGYQVRGMDLAIASGRMAAEAACEAIDADDISKTGLDGYRKRMEESFVIKDLRSFKAWPSYMEHWTRMFTSYPKLCTGIFETIFVVDGQPAQPLRKRIMPKVKQLGIFNLAKDIRGALKAL
jgi:electron transfer flavoprotein-quinone oxidoreductase